MSRKNTYPSDVVLGERYRDTVSGYEGIATATCFFLHGCERVTLEQWIERSGELRELTFDAPRLLHVDTRKQVETRRTGGVRPMPTRTGANR